MSFPGFDPLATAHQNQRNAMAAQQALAGAAAQQNMGNQLFGGLGQIAGLAAMPATPLRPAWFVEWQSGKVSTVETTTDPRVYVDGRRMAWPERWPDAVLSACGHPRAAS